MRQAYKGRESEMPDSALPPDITVASEDFVRAFMECGTERQGGGLIPGPIPRSAITAYGVYNGYTGCEMDDLLEVVRDMDNLYLSTIADKTRKG